MDSMQRTASRRDLLKGVAAGGVGLMLGPVIAMTNEATLAKKLPRGSASALGIRPEAVTAFIDEVNAKVGGLHSMMLVRHGKVAAEAWWAPYQPSEPHVLYSLSKSFTSTAVGLAVAEGKLSVEDKVISFFPDKLPAQVSENLGAMRVKDLLTMSTGHEREPNREGDWVKSFLAAPVERKPGSHFLYNTSATYILSAIVQKVTGQRVLDYLAPRLFAPLGIEGATWEQSPQGIDTGGYGLKVRTEDIAKFGQLYLQKGKWEGKQLVPESWVADATKAQVSNGDPKQENDWSQGYGYQFWQCQHGHYRGDGAFGQYCIVMPEHDAVLAITSGIGDMGAVLKAAWTHLLPGMAGGSSSGEAELQKKLAHQRVPFPTLGTPSSPLAAEISGKTYRMESNAEGIASVKLTFQGDRATLETGTGRINLGTKEWIVGEMTEGKVKRPVAARGAWVSDRKFAVTTLYLDSPHAWNETFEFEGDRVTVDGRQLNVWFGPSLKPALRGSRA
jgi:CubicO group peptidase (beta-lactamase class C family)